MSLDPRLEHEVETFAETANRTLRAALNLAADPLAAVVVGERFSVTTREPTGIPLTARDIAVLRLRVRYDCAWDSAGSFLAVDASEFHVNDPDAGTPILRFEYVRQPLGSTPAAHIQVHGENRAFSVLAERLGTSTKRARAASRKSHPKRLQDVHLPVGGRRFRPAMEDVVEMLVEEFGIDAAANWRGVLADGRSEWRGLQAQTVVRDDPERAAEVLRSLGYTVKRPVDGPGVSKIAAFREI